MLPLLPIFSGFPTVSVHPCNGIYDLFGVEPMRVLSLGISTLLKECTLEMLRNEELYTSAIRYSLGNWLSFKASRRRKLRCLNLILVEVEHNSTGFSLHADFSRGDKGCCLAGLFTEAGIAGKLGAKDYDRVDNVAPFLGAIVDCCRDTVKDCPVTFLFTFYADIVSKLYCRRLSSSWNKEEFEELDKMIKLFKRQARQTFEKY